MCSSNYAFFAQKRACTCITSQLYDTSALDTTSPLPLLNSLTYLSSTSPHIREIITCDVSLERLVRLLRDFCLSPPPPEYSSTPSTASRLLDFPARRPLQLSIPSPLSGTLHSVFRSHVSASLMSASGTWSPFGVVSHRRAP
ncbi:hypothetical protein DFH11DRAFT_782796 [Phellopilus nigrolimitatus]|nr:hypothetical protein DFH11DRAFT_782796 [Phellopilus nigrolimitatus]